MSSDLAIELVRCVGVTKDFAVPGGQPVRALRGVDLEIRSGQLTLLVGPSGCGKTTLISLMAGIMEPTDGSVETLGHSVTKMSSNERAKMRLRSIGFIFQQFNLVPTLSVVENVAMPMLIAGYTRKESLAAAAKQLDDVSLRDFQHGSPSRLSGGQQQRVAIARALILEPRLIVCDEPTSALDAATGQRVMQTLRDAAMRPDRAVVVVTHDPRVYNFADRIVEMEDGCVINDKECS